MNLEILPAFVTKVTQLFDTFNVRFGVMLVGPAGGGKTTCYKALAHSMTKLRKRGSADARFQEVKTKTLNPKSISMDELYGVENPDDGAWTDGLASKIIRKMARESSERRHWCVFDGPVDALWIENMNTVLDDNCTLCLANVLSATLCGCRVCRKTHYAHTNCQLRPHEPLPFGGQELVVGHQV